MPGTTFGWINAVVGSLLLISAALQYNDPDPWRWILLYAAAAAACGTAHARRFDVVAPAAVGLASLMWVAVIATEIRTLRFGDLFRSMKADTPSIELGREALGLLIVAAWMSVLVAVARRRAVSVAAESRPRSEVGR